MSRFLAQYESTNAKSFFSLWTHKRHPIHVHGPYGRGMRHMSCFLGRKNAARYPEWAAPRLPYILWYDVGFLPLQWRHNEHDGVSNHQTRDCSLNRLFMRKSKKTSKLRFTGLCVGNSPVAGEFSAEMASNTENISIWWRHNVYPFYLIYPSGWLHWR